MRTEKDRKRAQRQTRKRKLRYLRERLAQATDLAERQRLIGKIRRVSPTAPAPEGQQSRSALMELLVCGSDDFSHSKRLKSLLPPTDFTRLI